MAYNSDEEEMVPEGLVEVAHAIVEFSCAQYLCFRPGQGGCQLVHRVWTHSHRVHRPHH